VSVGGVDGFVDEDVDYALRLNRAGVPTELHVNPGACHGYFVAEHCEITLQGSRDIVDWLAAPDSSPRAVVCDGDATGDLKHEEELVGGRSTRRVRRGPVEDATGAAGQDPLLLVLGQLRVVAEVVERLRPGVVPDHRCVARPEQAVGAERVDGSP
jgi:hypothetical protein